MFFTKQVVNRVVLLNLNTVLVQSLIWNCIYGWWHCSTITSV